MSKVQILQNGVSLAQAEVIIDSALAHGRTLSLPPLTVAVLDCAGRLVALKREDHSSLLRPDIAYGKAYGSIAMSMDSRALAQRAETHPSFIASLVALTGGHLISVPGGVLILDGESVLMGAVGVSGAFPDQDEECAVEGIKKAGLAANPGSSSH